MLFRSSVRVEFRYNGAASIYRGPVLYALQPEEAWTHLRGEPPHADYEVRPSSDWNLAIGLVEGDPAFGLTAEPGEAREAALTALCAPLSAPAPEPVASAAATGARMWRIPVTVRRCPDWSLERGAAAPPPESPVEVDGPEHTAYLVPYAGTGLRIAEIPWYWRERG